MLGHKGRGSTSLSLEMRGRLQSRGDIGLGLVVCQLQIYVTLVRVVSDFILCAVTHLN